MAHLCLSAISEALWDLSKFIGAYQGSAVDHYDLAELLESRLAMNIGAYLAKYLS